MSAKNIKSGRSKAVAKSAASRTTVAKTALVTTSARQTPDAVDEAGLLADLRGLIAAARQRVATVANATHTMLCWHVGRRLLKENLDEGRAAYGKRILVTVSQQLTGEYGEGFTLRALYRSIQFAQAFPDKAIVSTLSTQLSWSHFMELFPIKHPLARDFYAEVCAASTGTCAPCAKRSAACCSSAPPCRKIHRPASRLKSPAASRLIGKGRT